MATNPNDSAFPMAAGPLLTEDGITSPIHREEYGLTKREYVAAIITANMCTPTSNGSWNAKDAPYMVQQSVAIADALLKELSK